MVEQLIAMALRFRVAVVGGTLLLIGAGAWALATLNLDAFPDLTPNQVEVLTAAPGLSPNEVENLVSYPLETAMMGLPRTQGVRSLSKAGISVVTIAFEDDVEIFFARAQVQQRMQEAAEALPEGLHPTLGPAATPMGEIFQYLVESRLGFADGVEQPSGVHDQAAASHDSRGRRRQHLGRDGAAVSCRHRSEPPDRLWADL